MTIAPDHDRGTSHVAAGAPRDVIDVEWAATDGSAGGLVRVDVRADRGATAFLAALVRPGRDPVVVIDHDLPLPGAAIELRAPGIWTELLCEVALDHWTIGLEAFALAVDDAASVGPDTVGDRTPLGLDLDLDTIAEPVPDGEAGFAMEIRVHGEVLLADERIELDGTGIRRRRWDGNVPTLARPVPGGATIGSLAVEWPAGDGEAVRRCLVGRSDGDYTWVAGSGSDEV